MQSLQIMSEKIKSKSKAKLAFLLPRSSYFKDNTATRDPPRRNSMPVSRTLESALVGAASARSNTTTSISKSGHSAEPSNRPRTLSTPPPISTLPSCYTRKDRRPSSPTGSPAQFRRSIRLSIREQQIAKERRAATQESEGCTAELRRQGIKTRDFQMEHELKALRISLDRGFSLGPLTSQSHLPVKSEGAMDDEEEDMVVMKGRNTDRGGTKHAQSDVEKR
jgi:hypothetical protein